MIVVNSGGALLRTRSVTGPPTPSSSPSLTVPCSLVAVNSNDAGVAAPSTAVYRCPDRIARISTRASAAASPENGRSGLTWIDSTRNDDS